MKKVLLFMIRNSLMVLERKRFCTFWDEDDWISLPRINIFEEENIGTSLFAFLPINKWFDDSSRERVIHFIKFKKKKKFKNKRITLFLNDK
jgi:hypothetical protein